MSPGLPLRSEPLKGNSAVSSPTHSVGTVVVSSDIDGPWASLTLHNVAGPEPARASDPSRHSVRTSLSQMQLPRGRQGRTADNGGNPVGQGDLDP